MVRNERLTEEIGEVRRQSEEMTRRIADSMALRLIGIPVFSEPRVANGEPFVPVEWKDSSVGARRIARSIPVEELRSGGKRGDN